MSGESRVYIIDRKNKLWIALLKVQRVVLFLTSALVIGIISAGAAMRYILKVDFFGIEDVTLTISFFMYFIGGAYAAYSNNHISAQVIPDLMKNKKARNILLIAKSFITVCLSWLFTYWGFLMVKWGLEQGGTTPSLGIPLIFSKGAISAGLFLISIYFTIYFIEDILNYKNNNYTDFLMDRRVEE